METSSSNNTDQWENIMITELAKWYKNEYRRRTDAINNGEGRIDWLDEGTRVSFSEIQEKANEFGIQVNVVKLRLLLDDALRNS